MRAREFEKLICGFSNRSRADLDVRTRKLREHRMLPVGGRGLHAAQIGPRDAATMLIAVSGSKNAVDAVTAVMTFAPLVPIGGRTRSFAGCETLSEAIEDMLAKPALADRVLEVRFILPPASDAGRFIRHEAIAAIRWTENEVGQSCYYTTEAFASEIDDTDSLGQGSIRDEVVIGGGVIHQLSLDLPGDDTRDSAWTDGASNDGSVEYGEPVVLDAAGEVLLDD
ncbi:MAG: hypothetical protein ACRED5_12700 [Propylenella sp.]